MSSAGVKGGEEAGNANITQGGGGQRVSLIIGRGFLPLGVENKTPLDLTVWPSGGGSVQHEERGRRTSSWESCGI